MPLAQSVGARDLKAAQIVLERLIRRQQPAGDYATAIVRQEGMAEVHLAFENESDARELAAAVQARRIDRYAGWASQCAFLLGPADLAAMAAALPPARTRPRGK